MKSIKIIAAVLVMVSLLLSSCTKENLQLSSETSLEDKKLLPPPPPGLCGEDYQFDVIGNTGFFSTSPKPITTTLEGVYQSNWRFNLRMIKRGEPIFIANGSVSIEEVALIDALTGLPDYNLLPDLISAVKGNLLKQELACEMKEYVNLNYPGQFIYDVDVETIEVIALTTGERTLKADFKIGF